MDDHSQKDFIHMYIKIILYYLVLLCQLIWLCPVSYLKKIFQKMTNSSECYLNLKSIIFIHQILA